MAQNNPKYKKQNAKMHVQLPQQGFFKIIKTKILPPATGTKEVKNDPLLQVAYDYPNIPNKKSNDHDIWIIEIVSGCV